MDLTCAVNITGVDLPRRLLGRKLNDGVVGAAGCASALCVLYNSWPARQRRPQLESSRQQQQQQLQRQSVLLPPPPRLQVTDREQSRNGGGVAA